MLVASHRMVALVALVAACAAPPEAESAFTRRDSAGLAIVESRTELVTDRCSVDPEPVVVIGGDGTPEGEELYQVSGAARLGDGRIAVVAGGSTEVRWYNPDGSLAGRAGRAGRGPGEFASPYYLVRTVGDTVWVGDASPWQWLVFGPTMRWTRTVRIDPVEANFPELHAVFDDGQQLYAGPQIGDKRAFELDSVPLLRYGPTGRVIDTVARLAYGRYGQVDDDPSSVWLKPWFEGYPLAAGSGDRLVLVTWDEAELRVFRVAEQVTPTMILRWSTGDRSVPSSAVAVARADLTARFADIPEDRRRQLLDPQVSPDRPVADRYPAADMLVVSRDGRSWVRSYAVDAVDDREWLGFGADGRLECRMVLPQMAILEIGPDYLLAARSDSLGLQRVEQYRLGAPTPFE